MKEQEFQKLIEELKKVPFFEWATRNFNFNFWEINQTGYYNHYKHYIGIKFKYVLIVSYEQNQIMYRNKIQQAAFIKQLGQRAKSFKFLIDTEHKIRKSYLSFWKLLEKFNETNWKNKTDQSLASSYQQYHYNYAFCVAGVIAGILIA